MRGIILLAALLTLLPAAAPARLRTVPAGYTETTLVPAVPPVLVRPVALAFIPGGRLLIGEQGSAATSTATIRVFKNGAVQATPYATINPVYRGNNESGLLGLAVDPNFATNGHVYAFITVSSSNQVVRRFTTSGDVGTSPVDLVTGIPTAGVNHNGGGIHFGPDGYLYVAVGENAVAADAQNDATWRGKILRFDTSTNPATPVPVAGNPFGAGSPIFSKGHRHPFRITSRPGTAQIFASENGPSDTDEINLLQAGGNYGWNLYSGGGMPAPYVNPTWAGGIIAVTDLLFYDGTTMPALSGQLLYVGYASDTIYRATLNAAGTAVSSGPFSFVTAVDQPVDIEVGPDGALYYSTLTGILGKVQVAGVGNLAPSATFTRSPSSGAPPLTVNTDGSGSYDDDGSITNYSWNWGDGSPASSGPALTSTSHSYSSTGVFTITLTVTDNSGATGTFQQNVTVSPPGNTAPSAHVESASAYSGTAPLAVNFAGHGHDGDAGDVLSHAWDFGDGSPTATFPGMAPDANSTAAHTFATAGTFTVTLTVTDAGGLSASNTVVITVLAPGADAAWGHCGVLGAEAALLFGLLALGRARRRAR
jgi:glucose/arabinose dehydrogenase